MSLPSLVVLGRDGVINRVREGGVGHVDDFEPLPGSAEAIARLSQAGIRVVVATNQQGLGRGELSVDALHDIHERLLAVVSECGGAIDGIFFAATGDPAARGRRQPKRVLMTQIRERYRVEPEDLVLIGDCRDDLEAARSVGCRALLVRTGGGEEALGDLADFDGVTIFADLAAAVEALMAGAQRR